MLKLLSLTLITLSITSKLTANAAKMRRLLKKKQANQRQILVSDTKSVEEKLEEIELRKKARNEDLLKYKKEMQTTMSAACKKVENLWTCGWVEEQLALVAPNLRKNKVLDSCLQPYLRKFADDWKVKRIAGDVTAVKFESTRDFWKFKRDKMFGKISNTSIHNCYDLKQKDEELAIILYQFQSEHAVTIQQEQITETDIFRYIHDFMLGEI